jgi:holo-[acyl-carrier protein] synthase
MLKYRAQKPCAFSPRFLCYNTSMIIGIGSDLANVERIGKTLERYGERFVKRVFTPAERAKAGKRTNKIATFAKRFAAKEACAKALGTGIHRGVYFRDMGVVNLPSGQPTMELKGGALNRLKKLTPKGMKAVIHLSLTDDMPWAQAFVVIEAISGKG